METMNIHEAKTHLSRVIDRVSKGETIIIAKSGKPLAKIVPLDTPSADEKKRLNFLAGELEVPDDFDTMGVDDIVAAFESAQ